MSADGEIEVSVKAEGVDDAAEELSEGDASGGGGGGAGGGGGGDGGLRGSLRAGLFAGLVTSVAGPLLETLDPILDLLHAFLAPVAGLMLRLMQPFLRFMLTKILPAWIKFLDVGSGALNGIRDAMQIMSLLANGPFMLVPALLMLLDKTIKGGLSGLVSKIKSLPGKIWSKMKQLPGQIGQALAKRLPDLNPLGGSGDGSGDGGLLRNNPFFEAGQQVGAEVNGDGGLLRNNPFYEAGRQVGAEVNISGGLGAFVDNVENATGLDLP